MATLVRHEARRYVVPIAAVSVVSTLATVAARRLPAPPHRAGAALAVPPARRQSGAAAALPRTARLCVTDIQYFALGRRFGPAASERVRRLVRVRVARPEWLPTWRLPAGAGSVATVLARPIGRHLVLAGAGGASARAVAIADLAGTAAYLMAIRWAGTAIW